MIIIQFLFALFRHLMIFEPVTKNPKWKFFFTTSMKKSLFLVAIAIGFGISCMLWSNGFIFRTAYGPAPIGIESIQVYKSLNLLSGQKNSINLICPKE